jgi:predicted ABC-type sugar transport system permease subunit
MPLVAADLAKITDPDSRRSARASMKEEALLFRRQGRRYQTGSKLADSVAKFGGGSLLTATLLLIVGGQAGIAIILTAGLTLLLFVAGITFWIHFDLRASQREFEAEWIEAVLKETER